MGRRGGKAGQAEREGKGGMEWRRNGRTNGHSRQRRMERWQDEEEWRWRGVQVTHTQVETATAVDLGKDNYITNTQRCMLG